MAGRPGRSHQAVGFYVMGCTDEHGRHDDRAVPCRSTGFPRDLLARGVGGLDLREAA
jgi:hypothetical protein